MVKVADLAHQLPFDSHTSFAACPSTEQQPDFYITYEILPTIGIDNFEGFHTIDINLGKPVTISWKAGLSTGWDVCQQGSVLSLISGRHVPAKLSHEVRVERIHFSAAYVDRVLGCDRSHFRSLWNLDDQLLTDLCYAFRNEWRAREGRPGIYGHGLAIALVIHLASNYDASGKKVFAPKGKLSSHQLSNVYAYTIEHIRKNIRLSELAAVAHMSEFHFARLFKNTVGISPYRFVLQMKVDYAKDLMKVERKTCSDIAYLLNFSDQAHFSHVFKKFTGVSPRSYLSSVL